MVDIHAAGSPDGAREITWQVADFAGPGWDTGPVRTETVTLANDVAPAIQWAWATNVRIAAGAMGTTVTQLVVFPEIGEPFLAGDCAYPNLTVRLREVFGSGFSSALDDLIHGRPVDVPENRPAIPAPEPLRKLSPPDGNPGVVEGLDIVTYELELPHQWKGRGEAMVCPKIDEGWGDCIGLDYAGEWPVTLPAYIGEAGTVEFWLVSDPGNEGDQVANLGTVDTRGIAEPLRIDIRSDVPLDDLMVRPERAARDVEIFVR